MVRTVMGAALLAVLGSASAARAETNHFEVWFNPSVAKSVSKRTELELETAQRFRDRGEGGRDMYFFRLWVHHKLSKALTVSAGAEQNWNDGQGEKRLLQQASYKFGILRGRSRFEQRFIEGNDRMALRFRQRAGVEIPLDEAGNWSLAANHEGNFTLRAGNVGGQTGFTSMRTIVEVGHEVSDRLSVSLGYVRQQDIRDNRPDRVGHAPLIGLELSL